MLSPCEAIGSFALPTNHHTADGQRKPSSSPWLIGPRKLPNQTITKQALPATSCKKHIAGVLGVGWNYTLEEFGEDRPKVYNPFACRLWKAFLPTDKTEGCQARRR